MLLEHDIQLEDFGGDVQAVCISALKVRVSGCLVLAVLCCFIQTVSQIIYKMVLLHSF